MKVHARYIILLFPSAIFLALSLLLFFRLTLLLGQGAKGETMESLFLLTITLLTLLSFLFCIPAIFYLKKVSRLILFFLIASSLLFIPHITLFFASELGRLIAPVVSIFSPSFRYFDPLIIRLIC